MDPCVPTLSDTRVNCDIRQLSQGFVDALENLDNVINRKFRKTPNVWRNRIKRGGYTLGKGLTTSIITHHAGMGDQAALTSWDTIQVSDPDADYDACRYQATVVDSGFSRVDYTGYQTHRRTKNLCLNDIKWNWEFQQQVAAYFGFLADVTARIWETWGRENYLTFCTAYVLSDAEADAVEVTYTPRTSADVTLPRVAISTLKWEYLEWYHQMLSLGAPEAALGMVDAFPTFGLVIHPKDWHDMIHQDAELREDYRNASAQTLLEHYGTTRAYKGYMIIGDMEAPRWKVEEVTATTLVCRRLVPYIQKPVTKGVRWVQNPEYVNGDIALGVIFLNDVYMTEVPPAGPAKVGPATFGTSPGLMGEFKWLNILDNETNPLGENGYYFARFQAFTKPLENHMEPICFFYKRCTQWSIGTCDVEDDGAATAIAITSTDAFNTEAITAKYDAGDEIVIGDNPAYVVPEGHTAVTVATSINVENGNNVTLNSSELAADTEATVALQSDDGLTMVLETTVDEADLATLPVIRAEGPNEARLTLAEDLGCGIGGEVTVTTDDSDGSQEISAVIGDARGGSEYVFVFAAGDIPAYGDLTLADGPPTVQCV